MNIQESLVKREFTVRQVMQTINQSSAGIAVVIDEANRVLATVTDGDIRRAILQNIDLDLPIEKLLSVRSQISPIVALNGTSSVKLLELMKEHGIRHIPIVDDSGHFLDIALLGELIAEEQLPVTAVIMAGGYGTRLMPLTSHMPKPMLPVGNRPLLELTIEQLRKSGIRSIILATHYKQDIIEGHFGDGSGFGVTIDYLQEPEPLGTAGALSLLDSVINPILVVNGDILTKVDFRAMLNFHSDHLADITLAVRQYSVQIPYGVVSIDGVDVKSVTEKPVSKSLINAGMYLLNPEIVGYVPNHTYYNMTDLITDLMTKDHKIVGFPVDEYWIDIGQKSDYFQAQMDVDEEGFH